jgi:hypothetical protein
VAYDWLFVAASVTPRGYVALHPTLTCIRCHLQCTVASIHDNNSVLVHITYFEVLKYTLCATSTCCTGYCLAVFTSVVSDLTADGASESAKARLHSAASALQQQQQQHQQHAGEATSSAEYTIPLYDFTQRSSSSTSSSDTFGGSSIQASEKQQSTAGAAAAAAVKLFDAVLHVSDSTTEHIELQEPLLSESHAQGRY